MYVASFLAILLTSDSQSAKPQSPVTSHSQGLHGYISFQHEPLPPKGGFTAGLGFYAAVWPLTDKPLAGFQIDKPLRGLGKQK